MWPLNIFPRSGSLSPIMSLNLGVIKLFILGGWLELFWQYLQLFCSEARKHTAIEIGACVSWTNVNQTFGFEQIGFVVLTGSNSIAFSYQRANLTKFSFSTGTKSNICLVFNSFNKFPFSDFQTIKGIKGKLEGGWNHPKKRKAIKEGSFLFYFKTMMNFSQCSTFFVQKGAPFAIVLNA